MLALTFDGGGVRGAMQAGIVSQIEVRTSILSGVTSFAGTSIGAFIAAALAFGVSPKDLLSAFNVVGPKIFDRGAWRTLSNPLSWARSKYTNENLYQIVHYFFGDKVFGDLHKKSLLIPTLGLDVEHHGGSHARPVIYSNIGAKATRDKSITEAVMQSMAAPVYFPIFRNAIDGGIYANNPSMSLLSELLRANWSIDKIHLLSIGSGSNPISLKAGDKAWGLLDWVRKGHLLSLLLGEATTGSNHYYTETLLGLRYQRIQPHFDGMVEIDRWEDTLWLIRAGLELEIDGVVQWLITLRESFNSTAT